MDLDDSKLFLTGMNKEAIDKNNNDRNTIRGIYLDANAATYPLRVGGNFKVDWDGNLYAKDGFFENGHFEGLVEASEIKGSIILGSDIYGANIHGSAFFGGDYTLYIAETKGSTNTNYYRADTFSDAGAKTYYSRRIDFTGWESNPMYEWQGYISSESAFTSKLDFVKTQDHLDGFLYYKESTTEMFYDGSFKFKKVSDEYNEIFDPDNLEGNYPWRDPSPITLGEFGAIKGSTNGIDTTLCMGVTSYNDTSIVLDSINAIRLSAARAVHLEGNMIYVKEHNKGDEDWHPIYAYFA